MLDRTARNFSAQLATLAVGLLDRLLITGLLVQIWGPDRFGEWALILSFAGLAQLADLGLNIFYGNTWQRMVAVGDHSGLARLVRVALFVALMQGAALLAVFAVTTLLLPLNGESRVALLLLSLSSIANVMRGSVSQLYRAHGAFARGTLVGVMPLLGGVLAGFATLWTSGGMVMLAALHLLSQLPLGWGLMLADLKRRHPGITFRPAWTVRSEILAIADGVKWLAPQQMAPVIWLQAPVLLLGAFGITGAPLAGFILMRSLVGLSRQLATMLSNAGGVEVATSYHRGDEESVQAGIRSISRLVSVLAAASGAALIAFGDAFVSLWTGSDTLFDGGTMAWLVLGALAAASSAPLASFMIYAGQTRAITMALAVQGLVGLGFSAVLVLPYGVPGVAAGLALGEICGFGLLLPRLAGQTPWRSTVTAFADAGWCLASALIVNEALNPATAGELVSALILWSLVGPLPLLCACGTLNVSRLALRIPRPTRRAEAESANGTLGS